MNTFKNALMTAAMVAAVGTAQAAPVSAVRYGMKYNTTTCKYDVYMKVLAGSTKGNVLDQEASTAQLSIVVEHGTTIGGVSGADAVPTLIPASAITANEPKSGTLVGTSPSWTLSRSTSATGWTNTNFAIQRGALSAYDVYSFVPSLTNAFYPQMDAGDSVVLFSVSIATMSCGSDVRLWNNNALASGPVASGPTDPTSANFGGDDYNNGFGIGGVNDMYNSNSMQIGPPKPVITVSRTVLSTGIFLTASATTGSSCITIPTTGYEWTGPAAFTSTQQNPVIFPYTPANFGSYRLTVTNSVGCSASTLLASIPLPVTIARFDVNAAKCAAILNWATSSETSFDRFAVQYSADGSSFMTVSEVPSKKAATGSEYSYSYAQTSGKGYYRLKMIDLNGTFTFSETVSVNTSCGTSKGDISISPNPTNGIVNIRGIAAGTQVRIMDMIGKVVANEMSNGSTISVNLGAYANGMYNVLVSQDGAWEKVGQIVKN